MSSCRSSSSRSSGPTGGASAAASAAVSRAGATPQPAHSAHDHDHSDHEHGDDVHARMHREPDPNAPPLAIPLGHSKVEAKPVAAMGPSTGDPLAGKFTLADATRGLAAKGRLVAELRTELGKLSCELYEDRAPGAVANFVGLARGLRPYTDASGKWVKKPAYDRTTFHRIVRSSLLFAGDPTGTGKHDPGYALPEEIWEDAYHSERGLLCLVGLGPHAHGMQFLLLNGSAPQLDHSHTIFGKCGPPDVIERLSDVPVDGERPLSPPKIQKVTIRRVPAALGGGAADAPSQAAALPRAEPGSTAPAGKRAPCTLGMDQSCNADPSVSALWGRCTEYGVCECKPGFELSPTSKLCQPASR